MNMLAKSSPVVASAAYVDHARSRRRRAVVVSALLAMIAGIWLALSLVLTGGVKYWTSDAPLATHVMANFVCLCLAVRHAVRLRGQLDFKFAQALLGVCVIFGVYALLILGGRLYFSRPLLVSTACEGLVLTFVAVWARHKMMPATVAVIGPLTQSASYAPPAVLVTDSEADLRAYDVILMSPTGSISSEWSRALARAMLCGSRIRHIGEYVEEQRGAVSLEHFEHDHVVLPSIASYRPFKRVLDIVLVLAAAPIAVPALLIGMATVAVGSGWPVFFVQDRIGLGGARFRMWKLRTMTTMACADHARAAILGDQRVTGVGRFLRRFRLDEVPQLWNVLLGDMSLIGPRPEAVPLHDQYRRELPNYDYRYLVRPGITGWAQVNSPPSATTEEARRKLSFDLFYVKKVSLYLDLQILLRTFWTITSGSGVR